MLHAPPRDPQIGTRESAPPDRPRDPILGGVLETNLGLSTGKVMQSSRSARNFADDLLLAAAGLLTLWYAAPCCSTCGRRHLAVDGNGPSGTAPAEGASAYAALIAPARRA